MLFNSLAFLVFFVVLVGVYFPTPPRARWLLLLAASCYFYMAFIPAYILILGFTIAVDYVAGLLIERSEGRARRLWLAASIVANVGVLAVFKYYAFIAENVSSLFGAQLPGWSIVLPLGLSFHTFQAMSYTIEVYRGHQRAERHLGIYALYVLFWPQLVAGPIERPQNLLPQFRSVHVFDYARITDGLRLMAWGFFKKLVISDRASMFVDPVYNDPHRFSGWPLLVATYAFAFQIYCDFSGYTDIARGGAKVLGYELMLNFDRPYLATSIQDFWRRWHLSLSTWFRDYLYIPLGGSRGPQLRTWRNLLVVFLISGIWHGANWTFAIWGALHGALVVLYLATARWREKLAVLLKPAPLVSGLITFHLVLVCWVFFRAHSASDALQIITGAFAPASAFADYAAAVSLFDLLILAGGIAFLLGVETFQRQPGIEHFLRTAPTAVRWSFWYLVLGLIALLGRFSGATFIYFQF